MKLPKKLEPIVVHNQTELDRKRIAQNRDKINELIDYLSDKEANKGECKRCMYKLSGGTWRCERCGKSFDEKHPPQQEESKGECGEDVKLVMRNLNLAMMQLETGYEDMAYDLLRKTVKILDEETVKPQLKEESPKEDELVKLLASLRDHSNFMVGREDQCVVCGMSWTKIADEIERLTVSKEKIKREIDKELELLRGTTACTFYDFADDLKESLGLEEL